MVIKKNMAAKKGFVERLDITSLLQMPIPSNKKIKLKF